MFESQENQGFALAFTSLSIILLAFFIFLSSLAVLQEDKKAKAMRSLEEHFIPQKGTKNKITTSQRSTSPSLDFVNYFPDMSRAQRFSELNKKAKDGGVSARIDETRLMVFMPNSTLFMLGNNQIKAHSIALLKNIAEELINSDLSLKIEVYAESKTAEDPTSADSWQLSAERAMSLYRFFLDHRVSSTQMTAAGYNTSLNFKNYQPIEGGERLSGVNFILEALPAEAKLRSRRKAS